MNDQHVKDQRALALCSINFKGDTSMLKIQDLSMMKLLVTDQPMIGQIQGGLGIYFLNMLASTGNSEIMTSDSLYETFDNGFSSTSVFTTVSTTPNSSISMVSSKTVTSIG